MARVDARVRAEPVVAPGREAWAAVGRENDEYRHVRLEGRYDDDSRETLVQAVTARGLHRFRRAAPRIANDEGDATQTVTGLLMRLGEAHEQAATSAAFRSSVR